MTTVNLPTLKIHQLSQEQFNKAKNEGTLDNNAIYLTPDESVQPDWNQNDETAPDYIKNRTHYETEKIEKQGIIINTSGMDQGSGLGIEYKAVITTDINTVNNFLTKENLKMSIGEYEFKIKTITPLDIGVRDYWLLELENGYNCALLLEQESFPFYEQQLPPEIMPLFEAEEPLYIFVEKNKVKIIHQLDEKFIPNTYATIELLKILNINDFTTFNLTENTFDDEFYNHISKKTFTESSIKELYIKLYNHYKTNLIPNLDISPNKDSSYFKKLCSFERADLIFRDVANNSGSSSDSCILKYYFNLSNNNSLVIIFNISRDGGGPDLDSLDDLLQNEISLAFELYPKGTNITNEQLKQLAQEQIITPALTEEVY